MESRRRHIESVRGYSSLNRSLRSTMMSTFKKSSIDLSRIHSSVGKKLSLTSGIKFPVSKTPMPKKSIFVKRKSIAKEKINSLLRRQADDTLFPFIHRNLDRTKDIERSMIKIEQIKQNPRSIRRIKHLPKCNLERLWRETIYIPTKLSKSALSGALYSNITSINQRKEHDFYREYTEKVRLRKHYRFKFSVHFTDKEFTQLTLGEFIKLGEKRRRLEKQKSRKIRAAIVIQKLFRKFIAQKRYKEYIKIYNESQKRIIAALKIQCYYRNRKKLKRMIEQERVRRSRAVKKGQIYKFILRYIIKYHYRKLKLKFLLKNLDKRFKLQRQELVLSSVLRIQYHTRKFLKILRKKRAKAKLMKKKIIQYRVPKKKKKQPSKWRIVNRGGKIQRINIASEKRAKELKRKEMERLVNKHGSFRDMSPSISSISDITERKISSITVKIVEEEYNQNLEESQEFSTPSDNKKSSELTNSSEMKSKSNSLPRKSLFAKKEENSEMSDSSESSESELEESETSQITPSQQEICKRRKSNPDAQLSKEEIYPPNFDASLKRLSLFDKSANMDLSQVKDEIVKSLRQNLKFYNKVLNKKEE
ncbi:unnamed protein product [Moneuplotes crassus]|uniref:Uncharacterized protein n=1 Tax=Euplotes crassus TaxID=5936 RepID=A0AAD2D9I5_EUPCR|nr:unnamed protein product [Moneuplotes crassus]